MKHMHANVGKFGQVVHNWDAYVHGMDQKYFVANNVTSDVKKRAILLSMSCTYVVKLATWQEFAKQKTKCF